jgi:hypothetical protein
VQLEAWNLKLTMNGAGMPRGLIPFLTMTCHPELARGAILPAFRSGRKGGPAWI